MYPRTSLFLGSAALDISTQILILDNKFSQTDTFNQAIESGNWTQRVQKIDRWAPPTQFEKSRRGPYGLIKVTQDNRDQKIRGIGCFIAMTQDEFEKDKKVSDIYLPLRYFDYIVFMKNSEYREDMYL